MMLGLEGVLYVATGDFHLSEAIENAAASRSFLADRPIILVTDQVDRAQSTEVFDWVCPHPDPIGGYRDKILPLDQLPFRRTLYLDSDARLIAPVDFLFAAMGKAHLAAAHAPVRIPSGWSDARVPELFPELNSGVLILRRCRLQRRLIKEWLLLYDQLFEKHGQAWDQASLRSVVWKLIQRRNLRLALLPPEANLRTTKPWVAGKGLPVHVVHGRVPEEEREVLLEYLNDDYGRFRTWADWNDRYPDTGLKLRIGEG